MAKWHRADAYDGMVHIKVRAKKGSPDAKVRELHWFLYQIDPDWPYVVETPTFGEGEEDFVEVGAGRSIYQDKQGPPCPPTKCPVCQGLEYIGPTLSPLIIRQAANIVGVELEGVSMCVEESCEALYLKQIGASE